MPRPLYSDYRKTVEAIFTQSLKAVDPYRLIVRVMRSNGEKLYIESTTHRTEASSRLYVIAIGKAAGRMTAAFLSESKRPPSAGIIAWPSGSPEIFPQPFSVFHAGHPLPTQASIAAGHAARAMLDNCKKDDLVIVLISGGGSALFELPIEGILLEDLHQLHRELILSGLPIQEINIVRSAFSQVKGGGLARLAYPARVVSLILSDVVGDPLASIASGPTVLRPDGCRQARELLFKAGLWQSLPSRMRAALERPCPQRGKARRPKNIILAGNRQLIDAARLSARSIGFDVDVLSRQMQGEASEVGKKFARRLIRKSDQARRPTCLLMGGETTVTVRGKGKGGRNQELALAAAGVLDGHRHVAIASLASDGVDGPTDAAGGIVDGGTLTKLQAEGMDLAHCLAQHESYHALKHVGGLLHTGPTGTNVADLLMGLIFPQG